MTKRFLVFASLVPSPDLELDDWAHQKGAHHRLGEPKPCITQLLAQTSAPHRVGLRGECGVRLIFGAA
jgi:hypothetical protein